MFEEFFSILLGKAILSIFLALVSNFAFGLANQTVNEIIGTDPSKFKYTLNLVSILSIPTFVLFGMMVFYFLILVLSPLYFIYLLMADNNLKKFMSYIMPTETISYPKTTSLVRLFSALLITSMVFTFGNKIHNKYEESVKSIATSFMFQNEFFKSSECKTEKNSKISYLNGNNIIAAKKTESGTYEFTIMKCIEQ